MILSLAPMADITHFGFRKLVSSFASPHLYFSEMIHSPSLLCGGQFEKWYMLTSQDEQLIWQLTSDETETIKETIPLLLEKSSLGIDLNMGCSAPHIVATGAGFAWLKKDRIEVARYVRNARDAIDSYVRQKGKDRPILSVKMRLPSEKQEELYDFVSFLVDCGVDRVTVHPRFQKEKYSRCPHYEYVERLIDNISIPIFINGDIRNAQDVEKMSKKMPSLAGCMMGREAVRKPWIFAEIFEQMKEKKSGVQNVDIKDEEKRANRNIRFQAYELPLEKTKRSEAGNRIDLLQVSHVFVQNLLKYQPKEFQLLRSKRFFAFFCDNFQFSHYIRTRLLNVKSLDGILPILSSYFEEVNEDRWR